jgi:oligosaccharide repeat unit polymerase
MSLIAGVLIAGMAALQLARRRRLAEPTVILCVVWGVVLLLHGVAEVLRPATIGPLSTMALAVVSSCVLLFCIGDELAVRFLRARERAGREAVEIHPWVERFSLVIPWLALPAMAVAAVEIAGGMEHWPFLRALRWQLSEGQKTYGPLAYLVPVTVFCCWLQLYRMERRSGDRAAMVGFIVSLMATVPVLVLMTGRTHLALIFVFLVNFRHVGGRSVARMAVAFVVVFVVVYAGLSVSFHKGGSPDAPVADNVASVSSFAAWYAIGPIRAFDHALHHPEPALRKGRTTRFFQAVSHRLGLSRQPPPALIQPEVAVPFRTNVYTIFATYLTDFGMPLMLVFFGVLGACHQWLFLVARSGALWARYGNALMSYPLVMSFFQDQYLSLLSTWLQYGLLFVAVVVVFGSRSGHRTSPPPAPDAGESPGEGP